MKCLDHPFAHKGGRSIHFLEALCLVYVNLRSTKFNNVVYGFQLCTLHDNNWNFESTCQVEAWHLRSMYIMHASVWTSSTCVHFFISKSIPYAHSTYSTRWGRGRWDMCIPFITTCARWHMSDWMIGSLDLCSTCVHLRINVICTFHVLHVLELDTCAIPLWVSKNYLQLFPRGLVYSDVQYIYGKNKN